MATVGLSPALGTFLEGVVLADSEYGHELEGHDETRDMVWDTHSLREEF